MTIIDRIEMELADKNSYLNKTLQEDARIRKMLCEEAERKNRELKDEIDWRNGNYIDKSIYPYLYP